MVDTSAGKLLSQARLAKNITIDEAAHATKLRPDKIVALENDDFSRFGSLAYGKGFLTIYARYLEIDISDQLRGLELPPQTVSIAEYQYLNASHPPAPAQRTRISQTPERRERNERQAPSVVPLFVVLAVGGALVYGFFSMNAKRLGLDKTSGGTPVPGQVASATLEASNLPRLPSHDPQTAALPPAVGAPPAAAHANGDLAFLNSANAGRLQIGSVPHEAPVGAPAVPVGTPAAPVSTPAVPVVAGVANELVLQPLKKTWVRIRKNTPDSPPIFEDYLYPGVRPLKLRGPRFFVEVRDQDAVQILKNGHPVAYQAPGIEVE